MNVRDGQGARQERVPLDGDRRWAGAAPAAPARARRRLHEGPGPANLGHHGRTKLSPLDYARERLELFPDATGMAENIAVIEGHGQ
ncbi:hypothetical protein P9209_18820 [Prescottella defluvii]|nr:hypothetical protein P9209_18820 [Prescottella defluvii]